MTPRWIRAVLTLLTVGLCFVSRAAVPSAPEVTHLPNGARLVTLYQPDNPLVVIDVFFRVGVDDEAQTPGITSLVTRAWFSDGRYRSANQLQRDIGAFGTGVGSVFGGDFAEIWSVSGQSQAAIEQSAQTLLLNLVASPAFTPQAVTTARDEQLRALALEQANPLSSVLDRLRGRVWFESPQGRPLLGNADSISKITAKEVQAYYNRFFRPSRAVILVAGNITPIRARRLVEQNLAAADWREDERPPAPENLPAPERVPPGLRDMNLARPAPASILSIGYLVPGTQTGTAPDWAALLLLDTVLGGGKSARLFALRDAVTAPADPAGYEIRTLLLPSRSQSLWTVYAIGNNPTKAARDAILILLADLGTGKKPITDTELSRAKAYLKGQHARERQQLKDVSYGIGWAEVMGMGARFDTDYDTIMDAVKPEDVMRLAKQILGASNGAVVSTQ